MLLVRQALGKTDDVEKERRWTISSSILFWSFRRGNATALSGRDKDGSKRMRKERDVFCGGESQAYGERTIRHLAFGRNQRCGKGDFLGVPTRKGLVLLTRLLKAVELHIIRGDDSN